MVFGLFKRPADTLELYVRFMRLHSECPGAGYIYANGFKVAFGYAQIPGASKAERKGHVEQFHEEAVATFKIDKGSRMLAVQAVRHIADQAPNGWVQYPIDKYIIAIMKCADSHRELTDEDAVPPAPGIQLEFLRHVGIDTLADYVAQAEARIGPDADEGDLAWERGKSIAIFDMFAEHTSGKLMPLLSDLNEWTKR
jgi:hypothetical protein